MKNLLMPFVPRFAGIEPAVLLLLIVINANAYGQNLNGVTSNICNCRQIYTYKSSNNLILENNVIMNEYYNDTLLIVKYGRYDVSSKFEFNNFIEYPNRRDTFIIQNGIYSKILNQNKIEILSSQLFSLKKKSIDIKLIQQIPIINRKIFKPKEKVHADSLIYFVYDVISDSFIPNNFSSLFMDSISNIANYPNSLSYLNYGFDFKQDIFHFVPGWGFLKIDSWGLAGKIEAVNFVFTPNCEVFLKETFKNWK